MQATKLVNNTCNHIALKQRKMITGRSLERLGPDNDGLETLQLIVELFGEPYLSTMALNKPLSLLWSRPDRLATVELYIFGKCLQKIRTSNEIWLKKTIREIKKSPEKARGLCTEILYLGMFNVSGTSIVPAPLNNAGYDFSLMRTEAQVEYVSVKNIDISKNKASFERGCRKLRIKWQEKLRLAKKNLSLTVIFKHLPTEEDFELAIKSIKDKKVIYSSLHLNPKDGIDVFVNDLPLSTSLSSIHTSESVLCYCTAPTAETNRYLSAIRNAANNIYRHTNAKSGSFRIVFMRLHVNAEFKALRQLARQIVNEECNEVDCFIFYQPGYVRDEEDNSLINHGFLMEANSRFVFYSASNGVFQCRPPIGSISLEQSITQIKDTATGETTEFSPSDYFFQQGDIYVKGEIGAEISLNSPAAGIRCHGVFIINENNLTISDKITPLVEDLLLI